MNLLANFRTVLWSFVGIGTSSTAGEDAAKVKPLALLGVAAILLIIFGVTVYGLAHFAVSTLQ
jgi:amino acid transporter